MRLYILLLCFTTSLSALSCDSRMKDYSFECDYQDQFNKLKNEFKTYNINPLTLKGHIIPHVLGDQNYYAKRNEYLNHTNETLAEDRKWIAWKRTEENVSKLNSVILNMNDVLRLFGKLRSANGEINPIITYTCEDEKINNDVISLLEDYDLKTEEGYALITLKSISDCKDSKNTKSGKVTLYKNASVKRELNRWIVDFNDALMRYERNEAMPFSPYQYLADMRRWFLAVSPFSEGNEVVAEALMLYASKRLNLPPVGQPTYGTSVLLTQEENRHQVLVRMKQSLTFFSACLLENIEKPISEQCRSL